MSDDPAARLRAHAEHFVEPVRSDVLALLDDTAALRAQLAQAEQEYRELWQECKEIREEGTALCISWARKRDEAIAQLAAERTAREQAEQRAARYEAAILQCFAARAESMEATS